MNEEKKSKLLLFDLDDTIFDSTNQPKEEDGVWPIKVFDGLTPILESNEYEKILVTTQDPALGEAFPKKKIDTLGIRHYFSEIYIVSDNEHKMDHFKQIIEEHKDQEIIVIGNRIDSEIRYGNMLGLKTIFVKFGKYSVLEAKDEHEIPDHTITIDSFADLSKLI